MPERFALLLINTVIYAIAVTVLMFFIRNNQMLWIG